MAASRDAQKRWLTSSTSKLAKCDLATMLHKSDAWTSLPLEVRQQLYHMLPPPSGEEPEHDVDVHPLRTPYRRHIEKEVRKWQNDLADGKETRTWRNEALQAGQDRIDGKWAEVQELQRDSYWGRNEEGAASQAHDSSIRQDENIDKSCDDEEQAASEEQKVDMKEAQFTTKLG